VGWLGLRGRCAHCQQVISIRYPLIEALTGLLFLLSFWGFGFSITTLCYWVFLSWLVVLTFIDLDTFTLPNGLTQSGLVLGLTFQGLLGWSTAGTPDAIAHSLMEGLSGAVLGLWLFDIITWLGSGVMGQAAMGGGDAKLAAMLGAWFGWQGLLLASFLACGLGAFLGMSAIALGWMSRRQPMPFGPYLALGAVVTVFYGDSLIHSYLNLVGWTSYSPIP
jgi:leader peptidase (prepilin peptidase)/N-methyltransferase